MFSPERTAIRRISSGLEGVQTTHVPDDVPPVGDDHLRDAVHLVELVDRQGRLRIPEARLRFVALVRPGHVPRFLRFRGRHGEQHQPGRGVRQLHAVRVEQITDEQRAEYDSQGVVPHQVAGGERVSDAIFPRGGLRCPADQAQQPKYRAYELSLVLGADATDDESNQASAELRLPGPRELGAAIELAVYSHQSV